LEWGRKEDRGGWYQFAREAHPGGSAPIHRAAGKDASGIFNPLHPPGTIENGLDASAYKGMVDPATLPDVLPAPSKKEEEGERKIELSEIIGLPDFDVCPSTSSFPLSPSDPAPIFLDIRLITRWLS
jgi:cytochrome b involved in lipid metabolism